MDEKKTVIKFNNVTKVYKLYKSDRARFKGLFSSKVKYKENRAVKNLSFEVEKGESLALFGRNGAGKSTILKMISGVTYPTSGEIKESILASATKKHFDRSPPLAAIRFFSSGWSSSTERIRTLPCSQGLPRRSVPVETLAAR